MTQPKAPPVPFDMRDFEADDLFICDVPDAVLKDLMPHLEHPFYTLSKQPEHRVVTYRHNEDWIEVRPGAAGMPTMYDKELLIFAVSNLVTAINNGATVSKRIRFDAHQFLNFANRGHTGRDYKEVIDALHRLDGTRFATSIATGGKVETRTFGLIESTYVQRAKGNMGRLQFVELTLSDWLMNAVCSKEVLTLSREYFQLSRPLERRIYELARKHCGRQNSWTCGLNVLHHKSGSRSPFRTFKMRVKEIAEVNNLPDYAMEVIDSQITFHSRGTVSAPLIISAQIRPLKPEVYDQVREAFPGWDVYYLEREWRDWATTTPRNPEQAFFGFCKIHIAKQKQAQ